VLVEFRATPPSGRLSEALRRQGLAHQLASVDGDRPAVNGLLVASRWPLRRIRARSGPAESNRWLLARVDAPRPFFLGAMHVPNRVSGRKYPFLDAVLALAQRWRRGPALLIGDTNSGWIGLDEQAPAFNRREDAWMTALEDASWRDAFRLLHGDAPAYTWYSPNAGNGFRLDQAFVHAGLTPRLEGTRYEWGRELGSDRHDALSDHAALMIDLAG